MRRPTVIRILQALGLLLLAFVLLRVVGPYLVDLHSTPALILAALLLLGGIALVVWYAWTLLAPARPRDPRGGA